MKTTRLVIGIVSMVLFLIIALQSCFAGIGNALSANGEVSGSAGVVLAIFMLVAGIIGVAARKSKGGSITAAVFYAAGGLLGIVNAGGYSDLKIWSILSFLFAAVFVITAFYDKKQVQPLETEENKTA